MENCLFQLIENDFGETCHFYGKAKLVFNLKKNQVNPFVDATIRESFVEFEIERFFPLEKTHIFEKWINDTFTMDYEKGLYHVNSYKRDIVLYKADLNISTNLIIEIYEPQDIARLYGCFLSEFTTNALDLNSEKNNIGIKGIIRFDHYFLQALESNH